MQDAADYVKTHCQSQLDLTLKLASLALGYGEHWMEISRETARQLLSQVETDYESLSKGDGIRFMTATGGIALRHWGSAFACGAEFQRQLQASLAAK